MKKVAYFDCYSGASGDMLLGTLLDKLVDFDFFISEIKKLDIPEDSYSITKEMVRRSSIASTKINVSTFDTGHTHRSYTTICDIIDKSTISDEAKKLSKEIFHKIAVAEAAIHQIDIEKIHFHEVGAIDSIIDIVGFSICYTTLEIDKCIVSPVVAGCGSVECEHGSMPVPAPATLEILKSSFIKIRNKPIIEEECLTPTAIAILSTIADECSYLFNIDRIYSISYGAGDKIFHDKVVSNLRLIIGSAS